MMTPSLPKRLTALSLGLFASLSYAQASVVIDFNSANDLLQFQQANTTFWSHTPDVGLGGTPGLTGGNGGTPGWMVYQTPFASDASSFSGGIYFKLAAPTSTAAGYSLFYGVSSSANYAVNPSTVADTTKNHYAGVLHYNSNSTDRRFRILSHISDQGTVTTEPTGYISLSFGNWYYLGIESEFDASSSNYLLTVTLHEASAAGVLGNEVLRAPQASFALDALNSGTSNYAFFGIDGRSELRGIEALDNFTYSPIPEPAAVAYLGTGLVAFLMLRRWQP